MTTVIIPSGRNARVDAPSDITYIVNRGAELWVESGGSVIGAQLAGMMYVRGTGTAENTDIQAGASQSVEGGTAIGGTIRAGGEQDLRYHGSASGFVVEAGGFQMVGDNDFGLRPIDASPSICTATDGDISGAQRVGNGGRALRTVIRNGGVQSVDGGELVTIGSNQSSQGGGIATTTLIEAGGLQYLVGTGAQAIDTIVAGAQSLRSYATADFTTVKRGGVQHVLTAAVATKTTVEAGGFQDVSSATVVDTTLLGSQQVLARGVALRTIIGNGGGQFVAAGASVIDTVINLGGRQYLATGAVADGTAINGGATSIFGVANDTTVNDGGVIEIGSGGVTFATDLAHGVEVIRDGGASYHTVVGHDGVQHVRTGGRATGVTVESGGFQDIESGAIVIDTDLMGSQQVLSGGSSVRTTIGNGAGIFVSTGARATDTVVNAGGILYLDVYAVSDGATVNGWGVLFANGVANDTIVNGGGTIEVGSKGATTDTKLVHGVELVHAGGAARGIDFAGAAGTLMLERPDGFRGTVSNFEIGDSIDLLNTSVLSYSYDGKTLRFTTDTDSYVHGFANVQAGTTLNIGSDGHGGTAISLSLLVQNSASLVPEAGIDGVVAAQEAAPTQATLAIHA